MIPEVFLFIPHFTFCDINTEATQNESQIWFIFIFVGAHLKKLRRAEGGAKILGVFRVKIHDFTPKKQITESPSYP
jgi:hypothetical protein